MTGGPEREEISSPRWRYLFVAAAIFVLAALILATLWQLPTLLPGLLGPHPTPTSATATPTLTPSPTATPTVSHPTLTNLSAIIDDQALTITFRASAEVPPDRGIAEVSLWYDTEAGRQVHHLGSTTSSSASLDYQLDVRAEGFTRTVTTTAQLDYWWFVHDTAGESTRAGGTVLLSPALRSMATAPAPTEAPVEVSWATSESSHFKFCYLPGTAAERDLSQLSTLAEAALERITAELQMSFDGQISIYFVPRVFWQGGATYGDKVVLISYLDRNYTGVETWTYFTHEGTHALAQDLIQPKENGGGPDGVLVEGLAVWASGGHYRQEPLDEWAAIIAASDRYIPLSDLRAGPFYDYQHEISYLEAGSFVKFLIERYGLDDFKQLYGRATGDASHDEALVQELYGEGYAQLEQGWLAGLADLSTTSQQAQTLWLTVRSFDLMRRYQTELEPNGRVLPPKPPTEWTVDTYQILTRREDAPLNEVLETALIAAQERIYGNPSIGVEPDLEAATSLLDDVEAAVDTKGELTRPSLTARQAVLDLLADQDRAVLLADEEAFRGTLDPAYAQSLGDQIQEDLALPFTTYRQEVVDLEISDDGSHIRGLVLLHANLAGGSFAADGHLYSVTFDETTKGWLMTSRQPVEPALTLPPPAASLFFCFGLAVRLPLPEQAAAS